MTLWARKYEFQITFGEDWDVTMNEYTNKVEYIITADDSISIDLDTTQFREYKTQLTSVGAEKVEMLYDKSEFKFRVVIPRERLPEDYDEEL